MYNISYIRIRINYINLKPLLKMKNKKNILVSIALGVFLFATVAPVLTVDKDTSATSVDKTKITITGKKKK